jgi:hypothetical protein
MSDDHDSPANGSAPVEPEKPPVPPESMGYLGPATPGKAHTAENVPCLRGFGGHCLHYWRIDHHMPTGNVGVEFVQVVHSCLLGKDDEGDMALSADVPVYKCSRWDPGNLDEVRKRTTLMDEEIQGMNPATLISEIAAATERLVASPVVDQKKEFVSNVYPVLQLLAQRQGASEAYVLGRLELIEATISEYLGGQESMILPELADIGLKLCDGLEALMKTVEIPEELAVSMTAYRSAARVAMERIAEVVAEVEEDEPDPPNGEIEDIPDLVAEALAEAEASEAKSKETPDA